MSSSLPLEDQLKEDLNDSSTGSSSYNMPALIIGIFIVLLGLLDMIILYAIPNQRIKENKKKLPDATFKSPNVGVIIVHFLLHILVILVGVFTILYGLGISQRQVRCGLIAVCIITLFGWIATIATDFTLTTNVKSQTTIDQLMTMINRSIPIEFAFIYSSDSVQDYDCTNPHSSSGCQMKTFHCYSKTGVIIPIDSKVTSPIYNFQNMPKMFYFTYDQVKKMSEIFSAQYNSIMSNINSCDRNHDKVTDYYPLLTGTYIVSKEKIPTYLKKSTRIASILFGVGIYYELSSKSIPFVTYKQDVYIDVKDGINYNTIFTSNNCPSFGECSRFNKEPKPY